MASCPEALESTFSQSSDENVVFFFFSFLCPAQTHFTSLNSLSFLCAVCLSSCIQSDNALKYFRVTIYFVKKCLQILTGWIEFLPKLAVSDGWATFLIVIFLKPLLRSHMAFPASRSHLAVWRYGKKNIPVISCFELPIPRQHFRGSGQSALKKNCAALY